VETTILKRLREVRQRTIQLTEQIENVVLGLLTESTSLGSDSNSDDTTIYSPLLQSKCKQTCHNSNSNIKLNGTRQETYLQQEGRPKKQYLKHCRLHYNLKHTKLTPKKED